MFSQLVFPVIVSILSSVSAQTVYMAGDSTMAKNGGGGGNSDGWGQYLGQYLSIPVVNNAIAGRSSRSFTDEGRFTTIANTVKSGDFVIIEFGHNDGSSGSVDNGRQCVIGDSYDTTATVTNSAGTSLVIHTYPYYIQNAITLLKSKGAIPILSSPTPTNDWSNGVNVGTSRFVDYCSTIQSRTGVGYVNHNAFTIKAFNKLGQSAVAAYFPSDHTHTSAAGANVVAQTFVRGLLCGSTALKAKVNSAGNSVPNYGC